MEEAPTEEIKQEIKIATVVPVANGIFKENLSYFTAKEMEPGSLVFVPVRGRQVPSILISIQPINNLKFEIKNSNFELKKIEKGSSGKIFLPEFLDVCKETAERFAVTTGQVIKALSLSAILEGFEKRGKTQIKKDSGTEINKNGRRHEVQVLQEVPEERMAFYKRIVREEFAKKSSVFVCVPTLHDFDIISEQLKKGIENFAISLDPRLSHKKIFEGWQKAVNEPHPVLIIGLPSSLSLPRRDVGMYIIERESSPAYKSLARPHIDFRFFARRLAKKMNSKIIFGDMVLRVETLHEEEIGNYLPALPLKHRIIGPMGQLVVNLKEEDKKKAKTRGSDLNESPLSDPIKGLLRHTEENKEKVLLICARKGLATSTVCGDCGEIVACGKCGTALVLHKASDKNVFLCHNCHAQSPSEILCGKCKSWRLKTIGFGTEKVEAELKLLLPKTKIFKLDGDGIKTHNQGKEIMSAFLGAKGGVLIGTEMALYYLPDQIENVAIISVDSMFSIPDFRMDEKVFGLITLARKMALKNFVIQTRYANEPVMESVVRGDILAFYRREIRERKKFGYPPSRVLIKITNEGPEKEVKTEMEELEKFLGKWNPEKFPAYSYKSRGKAKINILLKLPPEKWPPKKNDPDMANGEMTLSEILDALPPRFTVKIDPENIL